MKNTKYIEQVLDYQNHQNKKQVQRFIAKQTKNFVRDKSFKKKIALCGTNMGIVF